MQYLTYEKYQSLGGKLDETAFVRNIDRASAMIDIRTQNRLKRFDEIPKLIETVCADLIDYISENTVTKSISSKSQTAGGVSESESYVVKSAEDFASDLDRIFEPLATITTDTGISLIYRGAMS